MIKKILIALLLIVIVVVGGFVVFVNTSWEKSFNEEYPVSEISVQGDSAMIARGKYLVYGPAHCAHCHAPEEKLAAVEAGEEVPLTGGFGLEIPPGKFNAPNITMDEETGIGAHTDGEIYRMLRHNIRKNGHASFDFMPFINMSEEDIYSIIAYLRSTDAVKSKAPESELTFLGKMIYATGGIKPGDPDEPILQSIEREVSVEYGRYLAYSVANCRGCHTLRDMKTGEYIGEEYAGGLAFGPDNLTKGWEYHTPNLTNDPETGIMYNWTEQEFVDRMRGGRVYHTSPMPWAAFASMDEVDLKALYKFLKSLDGVENKVEKTAIPPAES